MGWMAIIDQSGNEIGVYGDDPWDIMGEAVDKIRECYKKDWHREPTSTEMIAVFEFVTGEDLGD
jgi:hypothetical protein